jgi:ferredoxin
MNKKRILLNFPKEAADRPIVYHLVRDFDLQVNIFRARITPDDQGFLVLDLQGDERRIESGIAFLRDNRVEVDENNLGLRWIRTLCTSCGNCLTHCPTGALAVPDRHTMEVCFDSALCVECLSCVAICPFGACSSLF